MQPGRREKRRMIALVVAQVKFAGDCDFLFCFVPRQRGLVALPTGKDLCKCVVAANGKRV